MNENFYAVIMAGGRGERFWPESRFSRPKQFVSLFGGKPLIAIAVERLEGLVRPDHILVVTSADLVELTQQSLPMLPAENILGEPFGCDTAAACAIGTAWVARQGGDSATMAILTADHLMKNSAGFRKVLGDCADYVAKAPVISVIGIQPEFAATGYGYIEVGSAFEGSVETEIKKVECFVEKPDEETAKGYVASGRHFWNSGMFLWSVETFKAALRAYRPQLLEMVERMVPAFGMDGFEAALLAEYEQLEKISVDYAIMEKADNIVVARGDFGWDDVGNWVSAGDHFEQDEHENALYGLVELLKASGNTVVNDGTGHLVALVGVKDLVVVHTDDVTLVCGKEFAQEIKDLVRQISDKSGRQFT